MPPIAYCTNVHAGADLSQTRQQLERHALAVKSLFSPNRPMGLGLWLSAAPARRLLEEEKLLNDFSCWLKQAGLVPFTFNGFPYGDFHGPVVKHAVYEPTWADPARLSYTLDLFGILDRLLEPGLPGSVSTLPLAWGSPDLSPSARAACAANLAQAALFLHQLESETGRRIDLAIEPEPGCALGTAEALVRFYQEDLLRAGPEHLLRRHIGACHDVCHSAVMFEDQKQVISLYRQAGIRIGKVQISSALRIDFESLDPARRRQAIARLSEFSEDRYLHQTSIREPGRAPVFFEDLPLALAARGSDPRGIWAIHFHVPIYLDSAGPLTTSQADIAQVTGALTGSDDFFSGHYEVETYAWSVLPRSLKRAELAEGIADELRWFESLLKAPLAARP